MWIGFDGFKKYDDPNKSYRLKYDIPLFGRIIATGAIPLVESPDELISLTNTYVNNPAHDREGRRRLLKQEYDQLDGHAGERVAQVILDVIG